MYYLGALAAQQTSSGFCSYQHHPQKNTNKTQEKQNWMLLYVYKPVVCALAQVADNYEIDKVRIRLQWAFPGPLRCSRYHHSVVMTAGEKGDFSFLNNIAVWGFFVVILLYLLRMLAFYHS